MNILLNAYGYNNVQYFLLFSIVFSNVSISGRLFWENTSKKCKNCD